MGRVVEVRVPDIGDFHDIPVIETLVKPGDSVTKEQSVVTLESDKATLDVPSPVTGRVTSLTVVPGDRVSQGSLILSVEIEGSTERSVPTTSPSPSPPSLSPVIPARDPSSAELTPASIATEQADDLPHIAAAEHAAVKPYPTSEIAAGRIYASPSVRRLGRELGVDLSMVTGSGRGARIMPEDVSKYVDEQSPAPARGEPAAAARIAPPIDFSKFGEVERQPLSRIRRISGAALARNWATIPHVTNFHEADITDLDAFRVKLNQELGGSPKLTLLSFLVKAIAATLRFAPSFNASLDGNELVLKKYVNVAVAIDTPAGLVVPVIRSADQLGIIEIARELSAKASAAQAGKLKAADIEGACFTISSLGGIGGTGFTPIINAPEIAILGVAKATIQARYDGAHFIPRLILPLALSWDHRATDGVAAARFLVHLVSLVADFRRILL